MYGILVGILILDALILAVAVLLQAGQGGGLASLGSGAGTEVFMGGRQATTILTKITWWTASVFLGIAFILAILSAQGGQPRSVLEGNINAPAPVQTTPLPLETNPPAAPPAAAQPQPQQPPTKSPPNN